MMATTRSFTELVQTRAQTDTAFGEALLREGVDAMWSGDLDTGKTILRDCLKATVGFEEPDPSASSGSRWPGQARHDIGEG